MPATARLLRTASGIIRPTHTIENTADLLGVSTGLIWKLIKQGKLESTSIGRRRLVYQDSITRLQAEGNR
jgi:excisionase family DNA binding protein